MAKRWRGSGVRYTIGFVGRFAGLWLVVSIAAVLVAAGSSYLVFAERFEGAEARPFLYALELQTALTILALVGLAIFTTHRLAGPWIAVRRALEAVRDGNRAMRLRIRANDSHVKSVERAFNEMIATLDGEPRPTAVAPAPADSAPGSAVASA
jgi:nitrogen fixation/metabolism regulation signal transduction histidine kinase